MKSYRVSHPEKYLVRFNNRACQPLAPFQCQLCHPRGSSTSVLVNNPLDYKSSLCTMLVCCQHSLNKVFSKPFPKRVSMIVTLAINSSGQNCLSYSAPCKTRMEVSASRFLAVLGPRVLEVLCHFEQSFFQVCIAILDISSYCIILAAGPGLLIPESFCSNGENRVWVRAVPSLPCSALTGIITTSQSSEALCPLHLASTPF